MTPTMKLRFVEREITIPITEDWARCKTVRVLQQWWSGFTNESETDITGEWRDVPLEEEE